MSHKNARIETNGWLVIYDVKGQCDRCAHVVTEQKMASCDYNRKEFGNAHNCPLFKFDEELIDG
jgi:hypothetical protein